MILGVEGSTGSGKGCFSAWLLRRDSLQGRRILSNTLLRFPFDWLTKRDIVERLPTLSNITMYVSEVHLFFDSRDFASSDNKKASGLFTQTRKRNVTFLWDSQRVNQVEKRLRQNSDFIYQVTRARRHEKYRLPDGRLNPRFNPWAIIRCIDMDTGMCVQQFKFDIRTTFGLFDSEQIIDPMLTG